MASTSPKATRTQAQTPVRGRGRGRPRLYARGTSSAARRKISSSAVTKNVETTPSGSRRRPVYQNGYRPGGAGGGGRYIHPVTGEDIPAYIYKEIIKSGDKVFTGSPSRRAPPLPLPNMPPPGSDGYKPREERPFKDFHPGFELEQTLVVFTSQEIDGEIFATTVPEKQVRLLDAKEEEDTRKEDAVLQAEESQSGTSIHDGTGQPTSGYISSPSKQPDAASPVYTNGVSLAVSHTTDGDVMMGGVNGTEMSTYTFPPGSVNSSMNGSLLDPALAALTPPPILPVDPMMVAIDPALVDPPPAPAQTQTPAATPTDGPLKEEQMDLDPTPPPAQVAAASESGTPSKRGHSDVPTLASLRAHRTTAGKPPPRSLPPPSQARRRPQPNQYTVQHQEKLNLHVPSFRKIQPFSTSEARYGGSTSSKRARGRPSSGSAAASSSEPFKLSQEMIAIGYQSTSKFQCPETLIRDKLDITIDEELGAAEQDLVEYDMDEQDDKWLTTYNSHRARGESGVKDVAISRELFEFAMTKIEKEWINLERKMPKIQAKPHGPGTSYRRRISRGEGEDEDDGSEDSKCAICDDGECENANAIVFCDGCNLAVHQECYGVPYIPEGQWFCRKCQQIPQQTAHCVFCPNTDGAFKQTSANKWAHLLCALWIPEVRLANPAFQEPVEGVELVPKTRWKLTCYICRQKMGACIQCSNRSCFTAFHVTCGRRARLHMKMKSPNTSGLLQDSNLKALCHRHVPADWREENDVDAAFEDAQEFYQALFSDTNGNENPAWDANTTAGENGDQDAARTGGDMEDDDITTIPKRRGDAAKRKTVTATPAEQQPQKPVWKLPSGAPVIPAVLYEIIITSLSRFGLPSIRDFAAEVCKYWTLKREARRGASLVRRLQVQTDSNSFTSLEVVRKNYGALGKTQGGIKLEHRKEYADKLEMDLVGLVGIIGMVRSKEDKKVKEMKVEGEWLERMYFPECKLMREVLAEAENLDTHHIFLPGFLLIRDRLQNRLYPSMSCFTLDLSSVLQSDPYEPQLDFNIQIKEYQPPKLPANHDFPNNLNPAAIGQKIWGGLKKAIKVAEEKEKGLWTDMEMRTKEGNDILAKLTDSMPSAEGMDENAMDVDAPPAENMEMMDVATISKPTDSPSLQLVKEASPLSTAATTAATKPTLPPSGGTILGTVTSQLAKDLLGSSDRPLASITDHLPVALAAAGEDVELAEAVSPSPPAPASIKPTDLVELTAANQSAYIYTTPLPDVEHHDDDEGHDDDQDAPYEDEDMEDAPGEVDEDFLPESLPLLEGEMPEPRAEEYDDLHDEDAEGEVDDECEDAHTTANYTPAAVTPAAVTPAAPAAVMPVTMTTAPSTSATVSMTTAPQPPPPSRTLTAAFGQAEGFIQPYAHDEDSFVHGEEFPEQPLYPATTAADIAGAHQGHQRHSGHQGQIPSHIYPDIDDHELSDHDLLGGYRPEDLPSPLGMGAGMPSMISSGGGSQFGSTSGAAFSSTAGTMGMGMMGPEHQMLPIMPMPIPMQHQNHHQIQHHAHHQMSGMGMHHAIMPSHHLHHQSSGLLAMPTHILPSQHLALDPLLDPALAAHTPHSAPPTLGSNSHGRNSPALGMGVFQHHSGSNSARGSNHGSNHGSPAPFSNPFAVGAATTTTTTTSAGASGAKVGTPQREAMAELQDLPPNGRSLPPAASGTQTSATTEGEQEKESQSPKKQVFRRDSNGRFGKTGETGRGRKGSGGRRRS